MTHVKKALKTTVRIFPGYAADCEKAGLKVTRRVNPRQCVIELHSDPFNPCSIEQEAFGKIPEEATHHVLIGFELEGGDFQRGKYPGDQSWKGVWIWQEEMRITSFWFSRLFRKRPTEVTVTKTFAYIRAACIAEAVKLFGAVERGELAPGPLYE